MKKTYTVTFFTCAVVIAVVLAAVLSFHKSENKTLKVGFIYVGDASTSYTNNFIEVQNAIADKYGKQVKTIAMCNVAEGTEEEYLERLIDSGCELIIATSYNYGVTMKKLAEKYPDIEFCMATCSNANEEPRLENYHTFMGAIYQGRYTAGVAAGMKLQELIDNGTITKEQAKILSKSVITSSLTKAAIYGHDANWGRILCAMGYSGAQFDPEKVDLFFESAAGRMQIIKDGVAVDYSEEEATKILSEPAVTAIADIKMGDAQATAWGCDLTYDYVKINADYRS